MRKHQTSAQHRMNDGWFWIAVLLVLPGCGFSANPNYNLQPGPPPRTSTVFCDIGKFPTRRCATANDLEVGIRLSEAAIALNDGRTSTIGIDDSPPARQRCDGDPEAVLFEGPFPQGQPVGVNCDATVETAHTGAGDICRQYCVDYYGAMSADHTLVPDDPTLQGVVTFCNEAARTATNQPPEACFSNASHADGMARSDYADPRRMAEPVAWRDLIGVAAGGTDGNDLIRTEATVPAFDAGAVSQQRVTHGDAFVEFSAAYADRGHAIGFSQIPASCPWDTPCPDADPTLAGITYAMVLSAGNRIGIVRNGTNIPNPDPNSDGTYGPWAPGERFRVRLRQNQYSFAAISFSRLIGPCMPGTLCNESVFYMDSSIGTYPFRVDASLRQFTSMLTDVRLVRITRYPEIDQ